MEFHPSEYNRKPDDNPGRYGYRHQVNKAMTTQVNYDKLHGDSTQEKKSLWTWATSHVQTRFCLGSSLNRQGLHRTHLMTMTSTLRNVSPSTFGNIQLKYGNEALKRLGGTQLHQAHCLSETGLLGRATAHCVLGYNSHKMLATEKCTPLDLPQIRSKGHSLFCFCCCCCCFKEIRCQASPVG